MGKKRKAGGKPYGGSAVQENGNGNSKMRINTHEDVADSEDEFHLNQDKILLDEGPAAKRVRKWKEQDALLQPSDEEVLVYNEEESEEEEEEEEEEGFDSDEQEAEQYDDEDIDGLDSKEAHADAEEDGDLGGWGPSKKDYYNEDIIQTEQDALDEEAEALRLQQKQLQGMKEADFGFDEEEWLGSKEEGDEDGKKGNGKVITEQLPQVKITDDMPEEERIKILRTRYPEFEHISKEFLRVQALHDELASAAKAAQRLIRKGNRVKVPVAITKYRTCAAYLAAMAMYFAVLTSTAKESSPATVALDPTELHDHAVMESLLRCQNLWSRLEKLPVADPMVEAVNDGELSAIEEASPVAEIQLNGVKSNPTKERSRKPKKTKAQAAAETAYAEAEALRVEKMRKTEQDLAALSALTDRSTIGRAAQQKKAKPIILPTDASDSDFGEETALSTHALAEKAKKKKSLRFYTSQIAQKANKRGAAGREQHGDADIPHRERLKDRQARLQAEAEKRGQKRQGPGEELGVGGEDESDEDAQPRVNGDEDEDYYDMVSARHKAKKQAKQELATAYAAAAAEGGKVVMEEHIGADSRKPISYAIQKNKGLTPHRKKEVRNPRVKKKLKFEAKKKKMKSQKAVYGGGEGRGGYKGELTGIKKGLVKSTKL